MSYGINWLYYKLTCILKKYKLYQIVLMNVNEFDAKIELVWLQGFTKRKTGKNALWCN